MTRSNKPPENQELFMVLEANRVESIHTPDVRILLMGFSIPAVPGKGEP